MTQFRVSKNPVVECVNATGYRRLVAIGDIHGCINETRRLLKSLGDLSDSLVVFLGDLVDRGPASGEVVSLVREMCISPNVKCVLGNHEDKQIRYRHHLTLKAQDPNYKVPMREQRPAYKAVHDSISDYDMAWLASLPAVVDVMAPDGSPRILTHAGVHPRHRINMATSGLIRLCYLDRNTLRPVPHIVTDGKYGPAPGCVHWSNLYTGARVIYGHAVHSLETPVVTNNTYGVDTGCVFGGLLTAYVEDLETGIVSFESVKAEQNYALEWNNEAE